MAKNKKHKTARQRLSFDGIANKFDKNIYGTSKGQMRHELLIHYLMPFLSAHPMWILDAGAGTGYMSLECLKQGHHVHLIDNSEDALEIARQRTNAFDSVSIQKSDLLTVENVFGAKRYDLILCHAVLEWLPKPFPIIENLVSAFLKPGGMISISFFNRDAQLFSNMLYGNFDYIDAGLHVKNQVRLNPRYSLIPRNVISFIKDELELDIVHQAGLRCFHDYMLDKDKRDKEFDRLFKMEIEYGQQSPFKWLGKYFHLIARKAVR